MKIIHSLKQFQDVGFSITDDNDNEYTDIEYQQMSTPELMLTLEQTLEYLQTIVSTQ